MYVVTVRSHTTYVDDTYGFIGNGGKDDPEGDIDIDDVGDVVYIYRGCDLDVAGVRIRVRHD